MPDFTLKNGEILEYRKLKKGDETLLPMFNKALSKRSRYLFMPHGYDRKTLKKIIRRSENGADAAFIALEKNDSGERVAAYWFLWWVNTSFPVLGIGILDDFHGQGLGTQLIHHLITLAEDAGCDAIELTTDLDNRAGQALYEKTGFKRFGIVENISGDGNVRPEIHMVYSIRPGVVPPARKHDAPV